MSSDLNHLSKIKNRVREMDNSGVGETLLVIVAGAIVTAAGFIIVKIYGQHEDTPHEQEKPFNKDVSAHSVETQVRFAAVVTAQQFREAGHSPNAAASLFSNASMRWAGTEIQWAENARRMELPSLSQCPEDDSAEIIVTFTSFLLENKIPTNRLTMRSCLNDRAAKGKLSFSGLYNRPLALNPTRFDFKKG
ncbi:hypothetical protein [Acetobacter orientalis]|nr:hypothetical protein [Acetobacter orientalis]